MNRLNSVRLVSSLFLSLLLFSVSWGQPRHQAIPTVTDGTASVEGTVQDAETKKPLIGAVVMAKNQEGLIRAQQTTGPDGTFQLKLDAKVDAKQGFILTTKAEGYTPLEEQIAFTSGSTYRLFGKVIRLFRNTAKPASTTTTAAPVHAVKTTVAAPPVAKITPPVSEQPAPASNTSATASERVTPPKTLDAKVTYTPPLLVATPGKTTQLRTIQFVQSKSELLPDAQPALEQLLAFLRDKPTVEIELAGHTDNQGDFDENLRLSKQRVDVVKAYLVQNGIAANRITTRGYGPTRPIASNNFESTRQLNRRVELIVVKE